MPEIWKTRQWFSTFKKFYTLGVGQKKVYFSIFLYSLLWETPTSRTDQELFRFCFLYTIPYFMPIYQILLICLLPKLNRHYSFSVWRKKTLCQDHFDPSLVFLLSTSIFLSFFFFFSICSARSRTQLTRDMDADR